MIMMSILLYWTILSTIMAKRSIEYIDDMVMSIDQISNTIKNVTIYYDKVLIQDDVIYTKYMVTHISGLMIIIGLILLGHTRIHSNDNHHINANPKKISILEHYN